MNTKTLLTIICLIAGAAVSAQEQAVTFTKKYTYKEALDTACIYTFYTNPKLQTLRTIQINDTVYARFTDEHFNEAIVSLVGDRHFADYECYDYVKIKKIRIDKTVVTIDFFDMDSYKYEMYIDESSSESNAFAVLSSFVTFTKKQGVKISKIKGLVLQAGRIGDEDEYKLILLSAADVNETFYHNPKEMKKALKNPKVIKGCEEIKLMEVTEDIPEKMIIE